MISDKRIFGVVAIMAFWFIFGALCSTEEPVAVPTFHCIGLYWDPEKGGENIACNVRYRPVNSDEWKEAMPLWFDPRGPEEHSQVLSRRTRGNREPEPQHDYSRQYRGVPIYGPNNGDNEFTLAPDSPGYDAGVLIPNFNDDFTGKAPDMGAHEAGTPPMRFGIGN